ncbi:MAG TPA: TonB-dependent receptor [Rhodothermia bacterium]|nr:TonB-dependent receptor [Rhodothermia bacterium]
MKLHLVLPLLLTLALVAGAATAQTSALTGRVSDGSSGLRLHGAHAVLIGADTTLGAVADTSGTFRFNRVHAGRHKLTVSFIGYASWRGDVELIPGRTAELEIELTPVGIVGNPITVTASKRPEKVLDAPASVTVLSTRDVETRTVLSTSDLLKGAPAVDLVSTGLNSSRIVIRGFNDNLAKSLLTMVDYRIAQVPTIRLSAMQLIPIGAADVDRIEIVSGPGAALYGPNSANGVVHILTKSPFESAGTTVSVAGGERSVFMGSIRHAGTLSERWGYKFSTQYYAGRDFEFVDPIEAQARSAAVSAGASPDTLRIGARNYDVENLALDGRVDYRFPSGASIILHGGLTRGNNIEISPTGAVQAVDALVRYLQARFSYRDLFAQLFYNHLDSGETFSLRTGDEFRQDSGFLVGQIQHNVAPIARTRLTYGADVFLTRPGTEGSTHGLFEDDDDINELGVYTQVEHEVSDRLEIVAAARADYHNVIDDVFLSPRLAVVYKPMLGQTARVTYNRAFQTPSADQFFTDVVGQRDVFMLGPLGSSLGFRTSTDLRAVGVPRAALQFSRSDSGLPRYRSPFAPLDPRGLTPESFIDFDDPIFAGVLWSVARDALAVGLPMQLEEQGVIAPVAADAMAEALESVLPRSIDGLRNTAMILDLDEQQFVPLEQLLDVDPLDVTTTETFEIGYKAFLSRSLIASVDLYHTRVDNFVGPFLVATPNIFLDGASIEPGLEQELIDRLSRPEYAGERAALQFLDELNFIGNENGTPADEVAFLMAVSAAQIPLGTISPEGASDPTAVLLVRRNFGDISLSGLDATITFLPGPAWMIGTTLSLMSDNFFRNVDGVQDVALNAPKTKAGFFVGHRFDELGIDTSVRVRFVDGFPVRSDVYIGEVDPYSLIDLSLNYRFPYSSITSINLTIQNLTDNKHREFVGVPEIGRVGILRLSRTF